MSSRDWASASAPGKAPIITSIFDFSAEALGQLKVYLEQAGLNIPISNVVGFNQFRAFSAGVGVSETTSSTSFVDLATVGPEITGLSAGQYVVIFGANTNIASPDVAWLEVVANGSTAIVSIAGDSDKSQLSFAKTTSLSGDNNSVKIVYKTSSGSVATFSNRFILVLKYANA